jgi:tRNA dimethylallyltransferase
VPHHLIDVRAPHEPYSAADFSREARALAAQILDRGGCPMLVGGTGLYFRAFLQGLSALPAAQPTLRAQMEAEARDLGWPALHERLRAVDPVAAARIRPSDPQRIQRALEVHAVTGCPMSALQARPPAEPCPWPVRAAALIPADREWLHRRIAARFQRMLELGLEQEVRALAADPRLDRDLPAMRAVGYRQMLEFLRGQGSQERMAERAVVATRQLARRQLTWLRKESLQAVFDPAGAQCAGAFIDWARAQLSGA